MKNKSIKKMAKKINKVHVASVKRADKIMKKINK